MKSQSSTCEGRSRVVALRPMLEGKCGNRQRKAACINCVERNNCAAITRHAAIEKRSPDGRQPVRQASSREQYTPPVLVSCPQAMPRKLVDRI